MWVISDQAENLAEFTHESWNFCPLSLSFAGLSLTLQRLWLPQILFPDPSDQKDCGFSVSLRHLSGYWWQLAFRLSHKIRRLISYDFLLPSITFHLESACFCIFSKTFRYVFFKCIMYIFGSEFIAVIFSKVGTVRPYILPEVRLSSETGFLTIEMCWLSSSKMLFWPHPTFYKESLLWEVSWIVGFQILYKTGYVIWRGGIFVSVFQIAIVVYL